MKVNEKLKKLQDELDILTQSQKKIHKHIKGRDHLITAVNEIKAYNEYNKMTYGDPKQAPRVVVASLRNGQFPVEINVDLYKEVNKEDLEEISKLAKKRMELTMKIKEQMDGEKYE